MSDIILEVKDRIRLKEGRIAIDRVLINLYYSQPISTKELARNSLLPVPVVTAMKKEFIKLGIMEQRGGVAFSKQGMQLMDEIFGLKGVNQSLILELLREPEKAFTFAEELAEEMSTIYESRPQVDVTIDQAKGTPITSVKRAILALKEQTLLGKNLLCVGDDDLVSVAIGFLLKKLYTDTAMIKTKVTVLEKDIRYVQYINSLADQFKLPIICIETDLREPMKSDCIEAFDAFFTDPPYTLEGLSLFLSRGIGGLKKEKGLKVFLSFGQKPNEDTYHMQKLFLDQGLIVSAIYSGFNQYEGASLLGNTGQMIVMESTDYLKPKIPFSKPMRERMYTGEMRNVGTLYQCANCKKKIMTGKKQEFDTIEKLMETGCPKCGGKKFKQEKAGKENNFRKEMIK